jgi:hemerythrin
MAALRWEERYAIGHAGIDDEHRALFEAVFGLHEALHAEPPARERIWTALEFLSTYTRTHFANEEALMARVGYPDLAEHRRQHEALVAQLADLYRQIAAYDPTDPVLRDSLEDFLEGDWLVRHVLDSDRQLADYLAIRRD